MTFRIVKDDNGEITYLVNPRSYELIVDVNLIVDTNTSFVVPDLNNSKAVKLAIFSYQLGTDVFVALNNAAAVPASSSFSNTHSDHLPPGWLVNTGDILNFITNSTTGATVTIRFSNLTGGYQ